MTNAISVSGLHKSFGRTHALNGLDLTVSTGEVHGFLGPNGAGKTTTIRVLLGLLRADAGTARLLGGDPWQDTAELHRRLAYVPGDVTLWPNLSGGEVIDLLGRLRGGLDQKRRASLLERFDLDPTKKGRSYSKGNRQKVALVAALASEVELLILDEPTSGLDPLMEAVFRECIDEERDNGRTVLLSSHILAEVEALCDRVERWTPARCPKCATSPVPPSRPNWRSRRPAWPNCPASTTSSRKAPGSGSTSTTTTSIPCCATSRRSACAH
jgi:ABC-2 type transport system ATP-binding protein